MGTIFTSPSRPFYQSVTIMNLPPIPLEKYTEFAICHFREYKKVLLPEVVNVLYDRFHGGTFYLQKIMNILFLKTPEGAICGMEMIEDAINYIVNFTADTYAELLYQLPEKQKQVLIAINREGQARNVVSGAFLNVMDWYLPVLCAQRWRDCLIRISSQKNVTLIRCTTFSLVSGCLRRSINSLI